VPAEAKLSNNNPPAHDIQIALTFDFDSYTNWVGSVGATSPSMVSRGEFGPIGVNRILKLLADYNAPCTFFIPGATAVTYPRSIEAIYEAGHEVGHHGWIHENPVNLNIQDERRILERGIEALERVIQVRPVGYRSPSWDNSPNTVNLLIEHGFEYESSLMGNDFEPYWCRTGDEWSLDEPYHFGNPTPLVEMPVAWHLDDWPWFEYIPGYAQGLHAPSTVLQIWKGEFDYLYQQIGHGVLIITMHPQCIGRGHRMKMLADFLDYIVLHPGVKFTTCINYVRKWRMGKKPGLSVHVGKG
jgi:peptidoglycan/xylan/chitin deacetylase (PgdA/CDA1 family)